MGCVKDSGSASSSRTITFLEQVRSSTVNLNVNVMLCGSPDKELSESFMYLYLQQNDFLLFVFCLALPSLNFKSLREMKKW